MEVTMKRDTRILVWLDNDEWTALIRQADNDLRHPREQARHILRLVLLGNIEQATNVDDGAVRQDTRAVITA
jgi:hypothetical protein